MLNVLILSLAKEISDKFCSCGNFSFFDYNPIIDIEDKEYEFDFDEYEPVEYDE